MTVRTEDWGGWVRVYLEEFVTDNDDYTIYLAAALARWLREHSQYRLQWVSRELRGSASVALSATYVPRSSLASNDQELRAGLAALDDNRVAPAPLVTWAQEAAEGAATRQ